MFPRVKKPKDSGLFLTNSVFFYVGLILPFTLKSVNPIQNYHRSIEYESKTFEFRMTCWDLCPQSCSFHDTRSHRSDINLGRFPVFSACQNFLNLLFLFKYLLY